MPVKKEKPREIVLNYQPQTQKAKDFHNAWRVPTRGLSGSQGSGKSYSAIAEILRHLLANPNFIGKKCLVVGVNGTIIRDQLLPDFKKILTNYDAKGRAIGAIESQDYEVSLAPTLKITFANGSEIIFLSLESKDALRAWTVSIVYADDLGRQDAKAWDDICSRARAPVKLGEQNIRLFTCNPDAPSHWIYQRYFKHAIEDGVQPPSCYLDSWTLFDNPSIENQWEEMQRQVAYSPVETQRRIWGRWLAHEGLIYTQFDRDRHLITPANDNRGQFKAADKLETDPIKSFSFVKDSAIYAGMDFGVSQGTGILYLAKHEDRFYVIDEYFNDRSDSTTQTHSTYIHRQPWHCLKIYCDHSPELLNNYLALGHRNMEMAPKGAGSILQGIDVVQRLFAEDRLFIHSKCTRLIKELESYAWKPNSNQDAPLDKDICLVDALRYVLMPIAGTRKNDLFVYSAQADLQTNPSPVAVMRSTVVERGPCIGLRSDGTPVYASLA